MAATFYCQATFSIPSRRLFVLAGRITQGNVKSGMRVMVPFNSLFSMDLPIAGVEFINSTVGADVGLLIPYADQSELELLQGFNIGGEELVVEQ